MEAKLLPYQRDHVDSLYNSLKHHKRALDASDTGTGKTYTSVALCKLLKLRPFVICPKSVISTWSAVLSYFDYSEDDYDLVNYEQLINTGMIQKDDTTNNYIWIFEKHPEDKYLFIFDEAHKCKNKNTINGKILSSLAAYNSYILLLSATIIDKPLYFIIFGYVLGLYDSYTSGIEWLSKRVDKKLKHPLLNVHKILFPEYASRMRVDDIQDIFKENVIQTEGIVMDNYYEIEREYNRMNNLLDNYDVSNISKIQKIRQHIEFLKVQTFYKMTVNYIKEGKSVALFVNFTKTLKELAQLLDTNCVVYGQQTIEQRSDAITDFCADRSRIIICNIQSGGAGISLHDTNGVYPRVSIISPTWSAQDLLQVLGRIHRATGKTATLQRIVFCKNTIEENIGNIIREKINNIRVFNDGEKKLKNDNMENIIQNEQKRKKKQKEKEIHIYKTYDFDAIQNRLDVLYKQRESLEYQLRKMRKFNVNMYKIKETEFQLEKLINEIDFNEKNLKLCVNNLIQIN